MKPQTLTIRNAQIADRACQIIQGLPHDPPCEVVIRVKKSSRSINQNNTAHKWFAEVSAKFAESTGKYAPPKWWKEYFKEMFLGEESFEVNGKIITRTRHTSDLNTAEMAEFMTKVDHYCGSELNIYVTIPGQDY